MIFTGPVTFPPSPIGPDTSGVVVGGSGYGFVDPSQSNIGAGRGIVNPLHAILYIHNGEKVDIYIRWNLAEYLGDGFIQ